MANWGVATWDANGVDNNTGIVRVLVKGRIVLEEGQTSGVYSFSVPSGYVLDFLAQYAALGFSQGRRKINITGGTVTISSAADNDYSAGTMMNVAANVIIFLRK